MDVLIISRRSLRFSEPLGAARCCQLQSQSPSFPYLAVNNDCGHTRLFTSFYLSKDRVMTASSVHIQRC